MNNKRNRRPVERKAMLGTMLDGTLTANAVEIGNSPIGKGYAFGLTWDEINRHLVIIGGTGVGKSETQLRIMSSFMALSRANQSEPQIRIIFVDAKGSNASSSELSRRSIKASSIRMAQDHGYKNIYAFPDQPIDGFSGSPLQVIERLSGLFNHGESEFHHSEATVMLELAFYAGIPPASLSELVSRMRSGVAEAIYLGLGTEEGLQKSKECKGFTSTQWNSVYLRLKSLLLRVGDKFDKGMYSFNFRDADFAYVSIDGTTSPQSAGDEAAWLLKLIGEITSYQDGRKTLVFLDEFSAIGEDDRGVRLVAGMFERVRSAGIGLVIGTQTTASLGDLKDRILGAVGTLVTHRNGAPEDVITFAGTVSRYEDTYEVDEFGNRNKKSGRIQDQFSVAPDDVRRLPTGECFLINSGGWAHVAIKAID